MEEREKVRAKETTLWRPERNVAVLRRKAEGGGNGGVRRVARELEPSHILVEVERFRYSAGLKLSMQPEAQRHGTEPGILA